MKPRSRGYGHSPRGRTLCGVAAASGAHPGSVLWISTLTRIEQGVNGVWIVEPALGEGTRGSEPRHPPRRRSSEHIAGAPQDPGDTTLAPPTQPKGGLGPSSRPKVQKSPDSGRVCEDEGCGAGVR